MEKIIEKLKALERNQKTISGEELVKEAKEHGVNPPTLFKELHVHYSYLFKTIN